MTEGLAPFDPERTLIETYLGRSETPEQLFSLVYQELRHVARSYMRRERADHTLQATALVNEAYCACSKARRFSGKIENIYFARSREACAACWWIMRAAKAPNGTGARCRRFRSKTRVRRFSRIYPDFWRLDQALERLAALSPRQAQVVELHSFAGLTEEEIAEVLEVSLKTVKNDWRFAKVWLKSEMEGAHP